MQCWEADTLLLTVAAHRYSHQRAIHLQAGELALAVLQLLRQAGQVAPGAREDVQWRQPRAVQATHHGLAHLLVRRAVPAHPAHPACALHCAGFDTGGGSARCQQQPYKVSKALLSSMPGDKSAGWCPLLQQRARCAGADSSWVQGSSHMHRKCTRQSSMPGGSRKIGGSLKRLRSRQGSV